MKTPSRQEGAFIASSGLASCYTDRVKDHSFNFDRDSLLLVAHGSSRFPAAAADLSRLAGKIRVSGRFARVDVAFWRQEPQLSAEFLRGDRVFVLPFFAGIGKHSRELIPDRLGLTGAVTRRGRQTIVYCAPVGSHPLVPQLIDRRAVRLCRDRGILPSDATLLLIAHGSRAGTASETPEAIAATLRTSRHFAEIVLLYLEQAPFAADWQALVRGARVIVQPLLLSAGMHLSNDLPALLGLGGRDDQASQDRQLWLQNGIGDDDEIIALLLDQATAAAELVS
jgi:sirohydrochlorin cobaltochelatase